MPRRRRSPRAPMRPGSASGPLISIIDPANARSLALARRLGAVWERDWEHPKWGPVQIHRHPAATASPEAARTPDTAAEAAP